MGNKIYTLVATILLIVSVAILLYSIKEVQEAEKRVDEIENSIEKIGRYISLLRVAEIVNNTLEDVVSNNFHKALNIRNEIFQQVPFQRTPINFNFMDIDNSFLLSLRDDSVGHICGGLAVTYTVALESQGIPARYVGIFSKDKEPFNSHATIEFWYQGKWYASDPTFNVMFKNDGEFLSYSQLYALIQQGKSYEVVSNGFPVPPKRSLENYYMKLNDLMVYMVVHPSSVWSNGEKFDYPMTTYPETWDGAITYENGDRRDVRNFGGIYEYLSTGPLR